MSIEKLTKYFELLGGGKETIKERIHLLKMQRNEMQIQKEKIENSMQKMDKKLKIYEEILAGRRKDFIDEN